jgi:hypothetical protein
MDKHAAILPILGVRLHKDRMTVSVHPPKERALRGQQWEYAIKYHSGITVHHDACGAGFDSLLPLLYEKSAHW